MSAGSDVGKVMTMMFTAVDLSSGRGWMLNAAHMPSFVVSNKYVTEYISPGYHLGKGKVNDEVVEFSMKPGDVICLFTDGIENQKHHGPPLSSSQRIKRLLKNADGLEGIDQALKKTVGDFVYNENTDDVAYLLFELDPVPAAGESVT